MKAIVDHASRGGLVLGVCNGFQILTEAGLLPGALMRNAGLKFVCKQVRLKVENDNTFFSRSMKKDDVVSCPVAHHDGNYFADANTLKQLEGNEQVVFRYADGTNPNGAVNDIAGIVNAAGNVIGMMPHPREHDRTIAWQGRLYAHCLRDWSQPEYHCLPAMQTHGRLITPQAHPLIFLFRLCPGHCHPDDDSLQCACDRNSQIQPANRGRTQTRSLGQRPASRIARSPANADISQFMI